MNEGLKLYAHDHRVVSIHGYSYPVIDPLPETFFLRGADCWGWATWRRGWAVFEPDGPTLLGEIRQRGLDRDFDFDGSYAYTRMLEEQIAGQNDSWAVRWYASAFLRLMLTLYPGSSQVQNIGADGSGSHVGQTRAFAHEEWGAPVRVGGIPVEESIAGRAAFVRYFRSLRPSLPRRILNRMARSVRG